MAVHETEADLIHTGPGTLAGRYLRTFWQPVCRAVDLPVGRAVPIRVMSEDFTLYRGESGDAHVVAFRCAHRGTQLSVGWVEGDCIRCLYHGWKYDQTGQCAEQPGEDAGFARKIRIGSYSTREYLGLVFAYFGAGEPPPLRRFPDFEREGVLDAGLPELWPCNYFNRLDNGGDMGHVTYAHSHSLSKTGKADRFSIPKLTAAETKYGMRTTGERTGYPPQVQHFHMPNVNQVRAQSRVEGSVEDARNLWTDELFFRVPVDDTHSVSFVVDLVPLTGKAADEYRERRRQTQEGQDVSPNETAEAILAGRMRVRDVDDRFSLPKHFWVEDYVTQVGQGTITDRSREHLGRLDVGVILLRKIWQRELTALAEGRPLKQWTSPEALFP